MLNFRSFAYPFVYLRALPSHQYFLLYFYCLFDRRHYLCSWFLLMFPNNFSRLCFLNDFNFLTLVDVLGLNIFLFDFLFLWMGNDNFFNLLFCVFGLWSYLHDGSYLVNICRNFPRCELIYFNFFDFMTRGLLVFHCYIWWRI